MGFRVLAENYNDPYNRRQTTPGSEPGRWWPGEIAHVAVEAAEETLCGVSVSHLSVVVHHDDADVPWCAVCLSAAAT